MNTQHEKTISVATKALGTTMTLVNELHDQLIMEQNLKEMLNDLSKKSPQEEALELVLVCARDIVAAWPTLTFRTMGTMTNRIDTLRQALEAAK
jgi:hypothetical protein